MVQLIISYGCDDWLGISNLKVYCLNSIYFNVIKCFQKQADKKYVNRIYMNLSFIQGFENEYILNYNTMTWLLPVNY